VITLALHSDTHIALRNSYQHKDAIKALASYPDVQWGGDVKAWLIDVGLLPKLYETLGDSIAPASPSFWMQCPLPTPIVAHKARRTTRQIMAEKRQQQAAAGKFGRAIVEMAHRDKR
jgi:hypothetical protein